MDESTVLWLIGQSVVIVGAVVAAHVSTKVAIAKLQANTEHNTTRLKELKSDHAKLAGKVDGISRHVATLSGEVRSCPHLSGERDLSHTG